MVVVVFPIKMRKGERERGVSGKTGKNSQVWRKGVIMFLICTQNCRCKSTCVGLDFFMHLTGRARNVFVVYQYLGWWYRLRVIFAVNRWALCGKGEIEFSTLYGHYAHL